ncbi:MAG: ribonuclease III [Sulfobacillus sp.]
MPWEDPLVQLALTHPSSVSEGSGQEDNQRLEFLGDAVLGLAIGQTLFRQLPTDQEGPLSRLRSRLVSREMLAEMGEQLNLVDRLKVGHGERLIDPAARQRALTDAFEALIGALFLIWGYLPTQAWVLEVMAEPVEAAVSGLDDGRDPKSKLQEALQHRGTSPLYDVLESIGPAHRRRYRVVVKAAGKVIGRGEGRTKKVAEQDAARDALEQLAKADQPKRRRPVIKKPPAAGVLTLVKTGSEPPGGQPLLAAPELEAPAPARPSRSRRRRKPAPAVLVLPAAPVATELRPAGPAADGAPAPAPRRRRRHSVAKAVASETARDEADLSLPNADHELVAVPAVVLAPVTAAAKRRRRRSRAKHPAPSVPAGPSVLVVSTAVATPAAAAADGTASAPRRRRRRAKHPASPSGTGPSSGFVPKSALAQAPAAPGPGPIAPAAASSESPAGEPVHKRRRHRGGRRRHKAAGTAPPAAAPAMVRELEEWEAERPEDD